MLGIALSTTKDRKLKGKGVRWEHEGLSSPIQQKARLLLKIGYIFPRLCKDSLAWYGHIHENV